MANLVEIHMLVPYGFNCLNRDGEGRVKVGTFGGKNVVRVSSQSKKAAVREAFGETYRTRQPIVPMMEKYRNENPNATEDELNEVWALFVAATVLKADKDIPFATKEMAQYSYSEIETIYNFILALDEKEKKALISGKDKKKEEIINRMKTELMKAELSDEIAVFGRMTTTALGETVPSAVHMNHMMSIDSATQEYDYFTAFDNVVNQSGMIGSASFAGNTMYGYTNIDPIQIYNNLVTQVETLDVSEEEKVEMRKKCVSRAINATIKFMKNYITTHPSGKQNSMASYPLPSIMYITYGERVFPCTAESAFVKPIFTGYQSVMEQGAKRLYNFVTEDAFPQEYKLQTIIRDSNIKESGIVEDFNDVRSVRDLNSVFEDVRNYLEASFETYLN
jgi:CRISPR system Cascade subunit CasC